MSNVAIIGCGFVADLYMRSLATFAGIRVVAAHDTNPASTHRFAAFWHVDCHTESAAFFDALPPGCLILNLTNPTAHYGVSKACLERGFPVYSEKPLAVSMDDAEALCRLAAARGLVLASAPCSVLGEAAQTIGHALRAGVAGRPRLIHAELDDGFISQAPFQDWQSESGAPWPAEDEFATGCTMEHAGYYLSWLISWFGSVETVVAASACLVPDKPGQPNADGTHTADYSVATLFFANGPVARLTCSVLAPHDHRIRLICDKGVLACNEAWDNQSPVRFHKRFRLRRKLVEHPLGRRIRLRGPTHPKLARRGAAAMNFALGPAEILAAQAEGRAPRLDAAFALHLNEVTLAIQNAGRTRGPQQMRTHCKPMEPMPWAR